ncbi:MAG: hypothetical protein IT281_00395 [Ignavibacteria bacterium]|nr:hypothetical protein [Ignavibacteria bacterium]MCC7157976.1 hypothetical protein [Ignavibacteria bacterium]
MHKYLMMVKKNINKIRISKGYRLSKSTHNLIANLRHITGYDHDKLLSRSCMLLLKELDNSEKFQIKRNRKNESI